MSFFRKARLSTNNHLEDFFVLDRFTVGVYVLIYVFIIYIESRKKERKKKHGRNSDAVTDTSFTKNTQ